MIFLDFYYDSIYFKIFLFYDSLTSVLQQLLDLGLSFSIVTNKPTQPSLSIIQPVTLLKEHVYPLIGIDFFNSHSQDELLQKFFDPLYF